MYCNPSDLAAAVRQSQEAGHITTDLVCHLQAIVRGVVNTFGDGKQEPNEVLAEVFISLSRVLQNLDLEKNLFAYITETAKRVIRPHRRQVQVLVMPAKMLACVSGSPCRPEGRLPTESFRTAPDWMRVKSR